MAVSTERLILWIGVPPSQGDPFPAEKRQSIPFITPHDEAGLKMSLPDVWQPRRPGLKGGGLWSDGVLQQGRSLLGNVMENVIEEIVLTSDDSDFQTLTHRMTGIQRIADRARNFSSEFSQIEPVYLEWSALGGFGSQYALIYNLDMNVEYDYPGAGVAHATITLVIEREPAWRAIPPGVSPRVWTKEWRGLSANYDEIAFTDSGALLEATLNNRTEYATGTDDYNYPSVSKNWAIIPKADIPGDAPALAAVTIDFSDLSEIFTTEAYIAFSSRPHEAIASDGSTRQRVYHINATDTTNLGADTTDTTNGVKEANSANIEVVRYTAVVSDSAIDFPSASLFLSMAMQRGKYAMFLRGLRSGGGGVLTVEGSVRMVDGLILLDETSFDFTGVSGLVSLYIGDITIPTYGKTFVSVDGAGQKIRSNDDMSGGNEDFTINLSLSLTTTLVYDCIDLMLVPIDEPLAFIKIGQPGSGSANTGSYVVDSTGYLSREHGIVAKEAIVNRLIYGTEIRGNVLTLQPGVDNAIILFVDLGGFGIARDDFDVKVDIVPRWFGVRDA